MVRVSLSNHQGFPFDGIFSQIERKTIFRHGRCRTRHQQLAFGLYEHLRTPCTDRSSVIGSDKGSELLQKHTLVSLLAARYLRIW